MRAILDPASISPPGGASRRTRSDRKEIADYMVKLSMFNCTVGAPLRTAIGEAKEDDRVVRMEATRESGPDTVRVKLQISDVVE